MFSAAVMVGSRLNAWNTKPSRSRRSRVSALSLSVVQVGVADAHRPLVRVSSPARQCSSVDLPEPDGPMIAVNAAAVNSTLTSARAATVASPWP